MPVCRVSRGVPPVTADTRDVNSRCVESLCRQHKEHAQRIPALMELLSAGVPVPFIARYRKEKTGGMDDAKIREIAQGIADFRRHEALKRETLATLAEGPDGGALRRKVEATRTVGELLDILRRETAEVPAEHREIEATFGALGAAIESAGAGLSLADLAGPFVGPGQGGGKGVADLDVAVDGAVKALALRHASDAETRAKLLKSCRHGGKLTSKVVPNGDAVKKYETYHDFSQPIRSLPSHRLLAILRGGKENALTIGLSFDREQALGVLRAKNPPKEDHPFAPYLARALETAWDAFLAPVMEKEVLDGAKAGADEEAIRIFARNLEQLLLLPPAGRTVVMGVEPGVRRGCKIAVVGEDGGFLGHASIYPFPPRKKADAAKKTIGDFCRQHKVTLIGIGSGPGCREVERFFRGILKEDEGLEAKLAMVNEAGAAAYSTGARGKAEFPKLDPRVRSAVTIARRLQDPMAELVKIDPGTIGVGPYQRDVEQKRLRSALAGVIEASVAKVGADPNVSGPDVLRYIPGLTRESAEAIVAWRGEHGPFKSLVHLKEAGVLDEKSWHFAAGFLHLESSENGLDRTQIHPENYEIAESMAEKLGIEPGELVGNGRALGSLDPEGFVSDEWNRSTVFAIFDELARPGGDPRGTYEPPVFRDDLSNVTDLSAGMELEGLVTNIASFGAFVDVGVDQEGLVHVSELSDEFVREPGAVVSVGQKVKVRVIGVEPERKRLSLSMRTPGAKKPRRSEGGQRRGGARSGGGRPGGARPGGGRPGGGRPGGGRPGGGRPGGGRPGGGRPGGGRPGGGRPGGGRPGGGRPGGGRKGGGRRDGGRPERPDRSPRIIEQKGRREPEPEIDKSLPEDEQYRLKLERLRKKFEKGS
ncbi:MAG: S1 RNA-binding domain-containing protein [Planctomycetota bacterium]